MAELGQRTELKGEFGFLLRAPRSPAEMPPSVTLKVELGPFEGQLFESGTRLKHITIGRTRTNRFQIKDETISQKHMSIDWIADAWMAQDLGSSNGTTINGESIGVKVPVRVRNGDLVRIGVDTRIRIVMDEPKPLTQVKEVEEEVEAEGEQAKPLEREQAKPQEAEESKPQQSQEQKQHRQEQPQQREQWQEQEQDPQEQPHQREQLQEQEQDRQEQPQEPKEPPLPQTQAPSGVEACGEMSVRDWVKQELVRIPMVLRERAEANIQEIELHAEQLKARLLTG